ncbi:hypothetical protein EJ08DRAFT_644355 [Tothia fuscella]|uniref:Uncharacterized protein n=1 Tax=Tothia fuscella TaxID=1048955 RepID=A0A9P4U4J5_9PEZI|nr:hypothetical protein EJ08DRAFT_644355 [Tothia fuscella]
MTKRAQTSKKQAPSGWHPPGGTFDAQFSECALSLLYLAGLGAAPARWSFSLFSRRSLKLLPCRGSLPCVTSSWPPKYCSISPSA